MTLWWLQSGWTDATCADCGRRIWPDGDPDWGRCVDCFEQDVTPPAPRCDICGCHDQAACVNGFGVCSQECADEAGRRVSQ